MQSMTFAFHIKTIYADGWMAFPWSWTKGTCVVLINKTLFLTAQ